MDGLSASVYIFHHTSFSHLTRKFYFKVPGGSTGQFMVRPNQHHPRLELSLMHDDLRFSFL